MKLSKSRGQGAPKLIAFRRCDYGGDDRDRTGDLWLAKPPLSQLSYIPDNRDVNGGPKWS